MLFGARVNAQFYEYGQDPSSLKWKRIDTPHFKIIFPEDFTIASQRIAYSLERNLVANSSQLEHDPSKIPLIIHNQAVYSNAFVTWAPKRMEFYTFPDPDLYAIDWLHELCLHEYRHVIQIDKVNQGFTKFLSVFLGQQANGLIAGTTPLWYIEGDAVNAETKLSNTGRGRLPSFEMELKAHLLSGIKPYSFSKAYLGSYKDFVPDYYRLGYQMVSYARKNYGDDYWAGALDYIGKFPFLVSPYYFYSKKVTGKGQRVMYKNTMEYLDDKWSKSEEIRKPETPEIFNKRKTKKYRSYSHPVFLTDSSVIALKTGINIVPRFVKINSDHSEKRVFVPGTMVSGRFSIHDQKIIYDQYVDDIRWKNRSYSVIKEYNMETGRRRSISRRTRFIFPSWSHTGDSILAVNTDTDYSFSLVILNSRKGNVLLKIPSPGNKYLQYPVWLDTPGKIAVIATGEKGKSIYEYDLNTDTWTEIFKSGFVNIDDLTSHGDFLYFNGGFSGIDEIYSLNLKDYKLRKHSNSGFGAFNPEVSPRNNKLCYSSYGLKGYDIVVRPFEPLWQEEFSLPDTISEQSFVSINIRKDSSLQEEINIARYAVRPYRKAGNLFRFHSWAPYWYDYMDPSIHSPLVSPGITLISQNDLSTALTSLGYERKDNMNFFHSRFTYKGFLPVFDFSSKYGGNAAIAPVKDVDPPKTSTNFYSTASVYLPLKLSSGKFITGLQPSVQYSYNSTYFYHESENRYKRGMDFLEPRLYFYTYRRTSGRDIQPRLGLTLDARSKSTPFENGLYGNISSVIGNIYLPGILLNQGLRLRLEWQEQNVGSYYFQNQLSLPRGYDTSNPAEWIYINMNKLSADYAFPIIYPDFALGPLLYLKRIRGNLFFDYIEGIGKYVDSGTGITKPKPDYPASQGIEIYADYHLFRFIVELSTGIRYYYLPNYNSSGFQILFNINLGNFN